MKSVKEKSKDKGISDSKHLHSKAIIKSKNIYVERLKGLKSGKERKKNTSKFPGRSLRLAFSDVIMAVVVRHTVSSTPPSSSSWTILPAGVPEYLQLVSLFRPLSLRFYFTLSSPLQFVLPSLLFLNITIIERKQRVLLLGQNSEWLVVTSGLSN